VTITCFVDRQIYRTHIIGLATSPICLQHSNSTLPDVPISLRSTHAGQSIRRTTPTPTAFLEMMTMGTCISLRVVCVARLDSMTAFVHYWIIFFSTMSAWLAWASMGLYPLTGSTTYMLGSPVFPKVTITLYNGATLNIVATNSSPT
jgi:hypothetical protein